MRSNQTLYFAFSVSNIFGKNRNKAQNSNGTQSNANNQWNSSPSSISKRRSGTSVVPNETADNFHDGFASANRKSPGIFARLKIIKRWGFFELFRRFVLKIIMKIVLLLLGNKKLTAGSQRTKNNSGNKKRGSSRNSSKNRRDANSSQINPLISSSQLH